jgi:uncharacterized protein (DUF924 family)
VSEQVWQEVLDFWFGDEEPPADAYRKRWFSGTDELDIEIHKRFEPLHISLRKGIPTDWRTNPLATLAAIIVIDQFSRNLYRRSAQAFEWDSLAVSWSKAGWDSRLFSDLPDTQKAFSLMPLVHSESLEYHQLAKKHFDSSILESTNTDTILTAFSSSAEEHHDIIAKYGRYPHRNEVLKRPSTLAEIDYLNAKGRRFGQ